MKTNKKLVISTYYKIIYDCSIAYLNLAFFFRGNLNLALIAKNSFLLPLCFVVDSLDLFKTLTLKLWDFNFFFNFFYTK